MLLDDKSWSLYREELDQIKQKSADHFNFYHHSDLSVNVNQ